MDDSKIIIERIDNLSKKLDEKFGSIDTKFDSIDTKFDSMDKRIDSIESRLDSHDTRLENLESDVRSIKLIIENDVMNAITVIAEGHMNLDRKLNEIIKSNNDRLTEHEIMKLKVNHLEGEIQRINERTGVTA